MALKCGARFQFSHKLKIRKISDEEQDDHDDWYEIERPNAAVFLFIHVNRWFVERLKFFAERINVK